MRPNKAEVEFYRKVNQQLVQKDKLIRNLQKKLDDLTARLTPPRSVDDEGHEVELELQQLEQQLMQMSIEEATQPAPRPPVPHEEPVLGAVEHAIEVAPVDEGPAGPPAAPEPPAPPEPEPADSTPGDWDAFLTVRPEPDHKMSAHLVDAPAPQLSLVTPRAPAPEPAASEAPAAPERTADADADVEATAYAAALTQRARRKLEHLRSMAEADSDAEVLTAALRLYEWYLWRSRQGYRLQLIGEDGVRDVDLLL